MLIFFYSFDELKGKYLLGWMKELASLLIFAKGEKFTLGFTLNF
jgi:hypothetical protein